MFIMYNFKRSFQNSGFVKIVQWWQTATNYITGSDNDPIEAFPIIHRGIPVPPDSEWECKNTLNHCPIELHRQTLADPETPQLPLENNSCCAFSTIKSIWVLIYIFVFFESLPLLGIFVKLCVLMIWTVCIIIVVHVISGIIAVCSWAKINM